MAWTLGRMAMILTLVCAAPVHGQEVVPRPISQDEAVLWTGVGSLRVAGRHTCTAVLISPSEAITAAAREWVMANAKTLKAKPPKVMGGKVGLSIGAP